MASDKEEDGSQPKVPTVPLGGALFNIYCDNMDTIEDLREKDCDIGKLSERILGDAPYHILPVFNISPDVYMFYNSALPRLFDMINVDIKFFASGGVDVATRSAVCYASSKLYECEYCTKHCYLIGGIVTGKRGNLDKAPVDVDHARTAEAVQVAISASAVPATITGAEKQAVLKKFGPRATGQIGSMIAMMGWLNLNMGFMGPPVEGFFRNGGDGKEDNEASAFMNIVSGLKLLPLIARTLKKEKAWIESNGLGDHAAIISSYFGHSPEWYSKSHQGCQETIGFMIKLFFMDDSSSGELDDLSKHLSPLDRVLLAILFSTSTGNDKMRKSFEAARDVCPVEVDLEVPETNATDTIFGDVVRFISKVPHPALDETRANELLQSFKGDVKALIKFQAFLGSLVLLYRLTNVVC